MTTIVFATGNPNKVREVNEILGDQFTIKSLKDIGHLDDIPETSPTLEGNALLKARFVKDNYGMDCFSEDTGLEIDALEGEPGVLTARYAGEQKSNADNIAKVLKNMTGQSNRNAQFRTVIALILNGNEHLFEGICRGTIRTEKSGEGGFGYDPIFEPEGRGLTFAEMDKAAKNEISHRGKAIQKMIAFLKCQS